MKIAINGRFLSQRITGVQRYAHELLRHLDRELPALSPSADVEVLAPSNAIHIPEYRNLKVRRVGYLSGQLWEQLELPLYCRGRLLFTPCGGAPVAHSRHVITIHDGAEFAFPHAYSFAYRRWYQSLHRRLAKQAQAVLTVSEFSRSELQRWCELSPDKIVVTYPGSEHLLGIPADESVLQRYQLDPFSYVLGVASQNPSKNLLGLMKAFSLLTDRKHRLVVVGGRNSRVFGESPELSPGTVTLGAISDSELRALYENAACFVFPSLYEGFGLPPLEALSLGCPVVASRAASLPEILGNTVTYCDPKDPADIARAIDSVLEGGSPRGGLPEDKKALFNWQTCARRTWAALQ